MGALMGVLREESERLQQALHRRDAARSSTVAATLEAMGHRDRAAGALDAPAA
eukprot:gene5598-3870_t